MRPALKPEGPLEHIALWANLGPLPVAEAMFGMATSRVLMAGVKLGLFAAIATEPVTAAQAAQACAIDARGAAHLLDCLAALGHVVKSGDTYALSRRARRWLDPASPTYIGGFLEFNYDQWDWWSGLDEVVRTGRGFEIHDYPADDPRWRRYIRAMFELARLSGPEVARKLRLPTQPQHLLDIAGGHGWFAAELCKRYPGLHATVLDLPGSVEIGREIISEHGMSDRVRHIEGDMLTDNLGGPYDAVLCFQIIHHLSPEQNVALFQRVHAALAPGGTLAIMDYFNPPSTKRPDSAAFLGLHFFLTSTAATYGPNDLSSWLQQCGFSAPRRTTLHRLPMQALYQAKRT